MAQTRPTSRTRQALLAFAPVLLLLVTLPLLYLSRGQGSGPDGASDRAAEAEAEAGLVRDRSLPVCRALLPGAALSVAVEAGGSGHARDGGVARYTLAHCAGAAAPPRHATLTWNTATGELARVSLGERAADASAAPPRRESARRESAPLRDGRQAEAAARAWLGALVPAAQRAPWRRGGTPRQVGRIWTVRLRGRAHNTTRRAFVQVHADTGALSLLLLTRDDVDVRGGRG